MRIRSALTEETLYGEAKRRAARGRVGRAVSNASPHRKLLRLVVLLGLVLILMREASDPKVYRNFFAALGAPLNEAPRVVPLNSPLSEEESPQQTRLSNQDAMSEKGGPVGDSPVNSSADDQVSALDFSQLVATLDPASLEELAAWLSKVRRTDPAPIVSGETPYALAASSPLAPRLESAVVETGEVDPTVLSAALVEPLKHRRVVAALSEAVDRALLKTVSDATIWSAGDKLAFYRLLEAGRTADFGAYGESATRVGYAPLIDQAVAYLGRPVWLEGQLARIEEQQAAANPFGVERYWLVWLRPDDGSERPVMAYAEQLPESLSRFVGQPFVKQEMPVRAFGVFLRRHLYSSQRGSELAPVIVGQVSPLEAATVASTAPMSNQPAGAGTVGMVVVAAILIGVVFAAFVAWRTGSDGRRLRAMRSSGLPSAVQLDALQKEGE